MSTSTKDLHRELRAYIAQGKTSKAIDRLLIVTEAQPYLHLGNSARQISATYQRYKNDRISHLLSSDEDQLNLNRIHNRILELIDNLGRSQAELTETATSEAPTSATKVLLTSGKLIFRIAIPHPSLLSCHHIHATIVKTLSHLTTRSHPN